MARLVTISGPTGIGKDALIEALLKRHPDWVVASSVTTRPKRRAENTRKRYYFVTDKDFNELERNNELLEWEHVHTWRYGTLKHSVEEPLAAGKNVLLNVDYKGALKIKAQFHEFNPLTIFLTYDPETTLREAIDQRFANDLTRRKLSDKEVDVRAETAKEETGHTDKFDVVIKNTDGKFDGTVELAEKAIAGHA